MATFSPALMGALPSIADLMQPRLQAQTTPGQASVMPDSTIMEADVTGRPPMQPPVTLPPTSPAGGAPMMPPPGKEGKGYDFDALMEDYRKFAKQHHQPDKLHGPDLGGMGGGILGSGITPLQATLFAIGALATRKVPSAQAWEISMGLAQFPNKLKAAERQVVSDQWKQIMQYAEMRQKGQQMQQQEQGRATGQELIQQGQLVPESFNPLTGQLGYRRPEEAMTLEGATNALRGLGIPDEQVPQMAQGMMALPPKHRDDYLKLIQQERLKAMGGGRSDLSLRTREVMAAAQEAGRPMTIEQARQAAFQQELALAKAKADMAPLPAALQKELITRETVSSTLAQVRQNFNPKFVGPLAGSFFDTRRKGVMPGWTPSKEEVHFRLALSDASDLILRARSGAAINEPEAARLERLLPKPTDDPKVFMAALDRFENEFNKMLARAKDLGTTPRGQAFTPPQIPAGSRLIDEGQ